MSRTLSKIMLICAIVAIFPLMIVGTAFAGYHSIDAQVVVDVYKRKFASTEDAYARVLYNGSAIDEKSEITAGHTRKITLKAVTNGYDFKGWFAGDLEAYATANESGSVSFVLTQPEVVVGMTDYSNLLAVFELKEYDVNFSYKSDPSSDDVTTTVPDEGGSSKTYAFGDKLPVLTYPSKPEYYFEGWTIEGDSCETVYTAVGDWSNYDSITLIGKWTVAKKVKIEYYDLNKELLETDNNRYENQTYTLATTKDLLKESDIEAGYEYVWVNDYDGSELTSINSNTDLKVYAKKKAIVYSAKLEHDSNDAAYFGSALLEFSVENKDNIDSLFNQTNWVPAYSFFSFKGINLNSILHNSADSLKNALNQFIKENPDGAEAQILTAEFNKNFTTFTVSTIQFRTLSEVPVYGPSYGEEADITDVSNDSSTTIREYLALVGKNIYIKEDDTTYVEGVLTKVRIFISNIDDTEQHTFDISADATMYDLIEEILKEFEFELSTEFVLYTMVAIFE